MMGYRKGLAGLLAAFALAGCGDQWFGADDGPRLEGERVSIMLIDDGVIADDAIANLAVTLPPPVVDPNWTHVYGNPTHNVGHAALGDSLRQAWRTDIGRGSDDDSRILSTPVAANGMIYAMDAGGDAVAVAAADGDIVWRNDLFAGSDDDRLTTGALAYDSGWLFAALTHGDVVGLNAETGGEVWRRSLRAPIRSAPTSAGGVLFVVTAESQLFALEPTTGDVLWRHAGFAEPTAIFGGGAPASDGNIVYVTYSSGEVFALRVADGRPLWTDTVLRPRRTLAIGAISDITGHPVLAGDRLIVAGNGGETASIDLTSGARSWELAVTSTQTPWVAGDFIYLLTDRSEVVALIRQGGRVRWVSPLQRFAIADDPASRPLHWVGPVLAGDRLILNNSDGDVVTMSPYNGEILGAIDLPSAAKLPPIVADNTVYFLTNNATLVAYR